MPPPQGRTSADTKTVSKLVFETDTASYGTSGHTYIMTGSFHQSIQTWGTDVSAVFPFQIQAKPGEGGGWGGCSALLLLPSVSLRPETEENAHLYGGVEIKTNSRRQR